MRSEEETNPPKKDSFGVPCSYFHTIPPTCILTYNNITVVFPYSLPEQTMSR